MTPSTLLQLRRVRWAVRGALTLGVAASVAANILHAKPNPVSQVIAAWPPLALLLTIELVSRVPVHRRGIAIVRRAGTTTIAGIAAWVSYWHMVGVAARYGETGLSPYLLPLSVDGLVVITSVSLVELAGRIRTARQPVDEPALAEQPAEPVDESAPQPEPDTRPEASPKATPAADAIARVRRRHPDLTQEEVAKRAKVSLSSVKRHWAATHPVTTTPDQAPVNGRMPELTTT